MSYCRHCGTEISDDTRFCPNCGQSQQLSSASAPARQSRSSTGKRLHCPKCRSNSISPVVETDISGGMAMSHAFSRRNSVSALKFNNVHRNYWMCSDCGHKFRNLQNLEAEISALTKMVKYAIYAIAFVVCICIFCVIKTRESTPLFLLCPLILVMVAATLYEKNKINKMEAERAYLKKHCFD